MRILHVTDCYLPRLGGIETHVHDLVLQQRAAGHDARILTATPGAGTDSPDPGWVHRVAPDARITTWATLLTPTHLREVLADAEPDVVHVHASVLSPLATATARQAAARGLPTLVTIHSMWSRLGVLPAVARSSLGLGNWPVHWSAVSDVAAEPLRRMLGPDVAVDVLPNAVDPGFWKVDAAPPDLATIVSVMRLARIKRPLPLARMLRQVRDDIPAGLPLRAVIIGEGPQRAALQRYLDRNRMSGWVELAGRLDRTSIRDRFARASVYVAPAELESFGIAALEARCAGLPVVASSQGGVGEFITSEVDGLLAATDREMAAAMAHLVMNEPRRTAIAEHNRTVEPELGWPAACTRSLEAYERAACVARVSRRRPHARATLLTTGPHRSSRR